MPVLLGLGAQVAIGAFLFCLGMQLGNERGSGTFFTLGGGNTRMIITFVFFCTGSSWAASACRGGTKHRASMRLSSVNISDGP